MNPLRILIFADDPLARGGLAAVLHGEEGIAVAGQVAGGPDLPEMIATYRPDVLLWDLGWDPAVTLSTWADADLDLADEPGKIGPPIVALLPDETHASDAWAAGARGILLRDAPAEALVAALQAAVQGLAVLDPAFASEVLPARAATGETPVEELTPRELEVLQLLAEGLSNRAVAQQLDISEHTVKFHVNAILGKLGAQSRTEAVVRATRLGMILL
jgi:two-component system nitrate/nitrite response regulator NarL